jgi:DNA-binding NtrC family response regulator
MLKRFHKILIVDDDPITRRMLEKLLMEEYAPITAATGQEAIGILKREEVSLLITDQQMPGMKGTELIRLSRETNPDLVCMLVTGVNDTSVFINAITKSGVVRIINKPWNAEKLLQDVRSCLAQYESLLDRKISINRLKEATENLDRVVKSTD